MIPAILMTKYSYDEKIFGMSLLIIFLSFLLAYANKNKDRENIKNIIDKIF